MKFSLSSICVAVALIASVSCGPVPSLKGNHKPKAKAAKINNVNTKDTTVTPTLSSIASNDKDRGIIDSLGRQRFFHGVNVVYKGAPYFPITDHFDAQYSFSVEDAKLLQQLNVNVIRLGLEWVGTEPVRGAYDTDYLNKILSIVQMCNTYGIYVLLDMHQDIYSEQFCGEGFPQWSVYPPLGPESLVGYPVPVQATPFAMNGSVPEASLCEAFNWPLGHLSWALAKTYQDLYDNTNGNLDSFAAFWKVAASHFMNEPNVLGYELMNEPWGGDQFYNPTLLVPGMADALHLQGAWDQIANSIREVDTRTLIFFEGLTLDNGVVGFSHVPGGDQYQNRSVLSYHWYENTVDILPIGLSIKAYQAEASRIGSASMLTEFDIGWSGGNITGTLNTMKTADQQLESWIGWEYKSYVRKTGWGESLWDEEASTVRPEMAKLYARTYPSAVQGKASSFVFDDNSGNFTMTFVADVDNAKGPTEIRVGKTTWYTNGMIVGVSSTKNASMPDSWSLSSDGTAVLVTLPSSVKTGDSITVSISPK